MKKFASLLLALLLLLGAAPLSSLAADVQVEGVPFDEVVEVTYFCQESDMVEYPFSLTDMPTLKKITDVAREKFGLELKLETCILTEMDTVLNTRLASGVDVPDIIRWSTSTAVRQNELYDQGLILNLSDYEAQMPNYQAVLEKLPSMKTRVSNKDGKVLSVSQVVMNPQHLTDWLHIRIDWLDKLGLAVPQTTEELRAALKAFQDNDMNGNGQKDETFAVRSYEDDFRVLNSVIAPAFGVKQMERARDSWYYDENNKVYPTMLTPEAKGYVSYMASLFADGLVWEQSFNATIEEFYQYKLGESRAAMAGPHWDSVLANTELNGYALNAEFVPVRPITDGAHPQYIRQKNYEGNNYIMLSASCKAPERVAAFLDWFYTLEGTQISYYGEAAPGGDYYVRDASANETVGLKAEEYEMVGTDKYFEELKSEPRLTYKLGANTIFPHSMIGGADCVAGDFYFGFDQAACGRAVDIERNLGNLNWAIDNWQPSIQLVSADAEQSSVISNHVDLFNYMEEMYIKFIKNVEPMENWDAFVENCYKMGMEDVLKVQQARFDAYLAASAG